MPALAEAPIEAAAGGLESLGSGLGSEVAASVITPTPAANLAGQLAAEPPEQAIADLANADFIGDGTVKIDAPTVESPKDIAPPSEGADTPVEPKAEVVNNPTEQPTTEDVDEPVAQTEGGQPPSSKPAESNTASNEGKQNLDDTEKRRQGMQRRDELSKKMVDNTATEDERTEFGKLLDDPSSYNPPENGTNATKSSTEVDSQSNIPDEAEAQAGQMEQAEAEVASGNTNETTEEATDQPEQNKDQEDPTETQKRIDELSQKIKDKTATDEELDEFKDLKNKSTEQERLKNLEAMDPKDMTSEQLDEMRELQKKEKGDEKLTPEQEAEKRDKEIEDLSAEMMQKLASGEELTPEEEERLQKLIAEKKMAEAGFTPDQARAAAKEALKRQTEKSEKGSKRTQEAKEAIQELMSMELQLISSRNLAKQLSERRKIAIEEAQQAHDEAERAKPQERMKKKGVEYGKYMIIANYSGQIEGTRYTAQRIDARRKDLEQQVRRKLGVTGGLGALVEWAGAQLNNIMTEIAIIAEEEVPFGMGAGFGEHQRGQLAASGRM